jgi:hypothetical protein
MPIWIVVLMLAAVIALVNRYLGLVATFVVIAGATLIHFRKSETNTSSAPMPYFVAHISSYDGHESHDWVSFRKRLEV